MTRAADLSSLVFVCLALAAAEPALAHDPVFSIGPHVLFKGGVEIHMGAGQEKTGSERGTKTKVQLKYGITGVWVAGIGIHYIRTEGRKWYRWASARRRFNNDATNGGERPDIWFVDLVGGIRFKPTEYTEPDWVWMLELNGEITENVTNRVGGSMARVGGNQWFLSPGLMWTHRNVAIKAGVQIPIYDDLAVDQASDDYRAVVEFELHM